MARLTRMRRRRPARPGWPSARARPGTTRRWSSAPAGPRRPTRSRPHSARPSPRYPLADLGGFAASTVPGTRRAVRSLVTGRLRLLVFLGRTHLYEGHPAATVVHGVRTAVAAGCRVVVLTNAAGGIRAGYQVGQPVLIRDHLNLTGRSPLTGPPRPPGYPPRFTDLTDAVLAPAARAGPRGRPEPGRGRVRGAAGPALRDPGRDRRCCARSAPTWSACPPSWRRSPPATSGAEVLAISLVTNLAAGLADARAGPRRGRRGRGEAADRMGALLASILPRSHPMSRRLRCLSRARMPAGAA